MSASETKVHENRIKTLDITYIAMGAVLIVISSWISIPTVVPFTLQTFAVFLVLSLLGGERGSLSILIYVLMGAVGLPVFSGFTGGLGILFGKTGGYIMGFILSGLVYILFTKIFGNKTGVQIAALLTGLFFCYAFGTAWFMLLYLSTTGEIGLITVLSMCVFPFIIPDLLKLTLALAISKRVSFIIK